MTNRTNPNSAHSLTVQQEIISKLEHYTAQSTKQLMKSLERPYHTVRQAIKALENDGQIVPANNNYRNTEYKLADGNTVAHKIIPTIVVNDAEYKIVVLLDFRKQPKLRAAEAVKNIPMHVTRLLKVAERLHNGESAASVSLETIKMAMQADRQALRNAVEIYDQLLKNGKIWQSDLLKRFVNDTDWNQADVDDAYAQFFQKDNKS